MKYLGVLVLINVLVVSGYFLFSSNISTPRVIGFLAFGVFVGILMVLADRITELEISKVGKFKAVVEQARTDADQIAQIRAEAQKKADMIDLVVRDANRLKSDVSDLDRSIASIKDMIGSIEKDLDDASQRINVLHSESEFGLMVAKVTNDDRRSFDNLLRMAGDPKSKYATDAQRIIAEVSEGRNAGGMSLANPDFFICWDRSKGRLT